MGNNLATILNAAGGAALVQTYLEKKFMERRSYDTVLANSDLLQEFKLPENGGTSVKASRKTHFRIPENKPIATPESDPASGASMSMEQVEFPMEFIHEYTPITTTASWQSWADLEEWAKEDMPIALMRRFHQLTQNAFKVGRYQPGVYASNGTVSTAFDTTAETTPTVNGATYTFSKAKEYFVGQKPNFAQLDATVDRFTMADFTRIATRMANSGVPKINGSIVAVISEAVKEDLMKDDEYFKAVVNGFKGEGLKENAMIPYRGISWKIDDEPFTENTGSAGVRATNGKMHTAFITGKGAVAYVRLGSKSKAKPTFKVQDISKTGGEMTIGYTVPFQVAVINPAFCATLTGPVTNHEANA